MNELPRGWAWTTLGEVAKVRLGRQRSPKNHVGSRMRPYLRAANVTWGGLDLSDVKEMNFTEAESAIYVISGRAQFLCGDALDDELDAGPGDFVWVPPDVVHVELNASDDEPVRMVVSRSTQETLVFNVDPPPGWTPPGSGSAG